MSKVSIITPIYNVENYLGKCIESALNQTEHDIELILVDDGSTDKSGLICDEFAAKDSRVKVLHKKNGGVSEARNDGVRMASSEFIMFLDSDDTYNCITVETALREILLHDADIAVFNYRAVDEDGNELYKVCNDLYGVTTLSDSPKILLTAPALWNKIFRQELLKSISFPKDYWYEDLRIVSKIYARCQHIAYIDSAPLYNYLIHRNSIMHSRDIEKVRLQREVAVNDVRDFYLENGLYEQLKDEVDWLYLYHGFFLCSREIMSFPDKRKVKMLMNEMRENLCKVIPRANDNPYFYLFNKREKLLFKLFYKRRYKTLNALLLLTGRK